jgi:hypothetical protein
LIPPKNKIPSEGILLTPTEKLDTTKQEKGFYEHQTGKWGFWRSLAGVSERFSSHTNIG